MLSFPSFFAEAKAKGIIKKGGGVVEEESKRGKKSSKLETCRECNGPFNGLLQDAEQLLGTLSEEGETELQQVCSLATTITEPLLWLFGVPAWEDAGRMQGGCREERRLSNRT